MKTKIRPLLLRGALANHPTTFTKLKESLAISAAGTQLEKELEESSSPITQSEASCLSSDDECGKLKWQKLCD